MHEISESKVINLNVKSVVFFMEDFCATLSFASDNTDTPGEYLILTREITNEDSGNAVDDPEWEMQLSSEDDISNLCKIDVHNEKLIDLHFDQSNIIVRLKIDC